MNIRVGSIVRIIANKPKCWQIEVDLTPYIGIELPVIAHWRQVTNLLENGEVEVDLPGVGPIVLNKEEYEDVTNVYKADIQKYDMEKLLNHLNTNKYKYLLFSDYIHIYPKRKIDIKQNLIDMCKQFEK